MRIVQKVLGVLLKILVNFFFRKVDVINVDNIPKEGSVILVGNHKNQFLDGMILQCTSPRPARFLIAKKSWDRRIIGDVAKQLDAIPVARAQDSAVKGHGKITCNGTKVIGEGTDFTAQISPGDSLVVSGAGVSRVAKVEDDEHITLSEPFESCLDSMSPFTIYKKIDQTNVYEAVYEALDGGCIAIFPEGGSHDRTELLPLKAGVTLMAFGSVIANNRPVQIVPCGLNYFSGHRFRSMAVVEFGKPIEIAPDHPLVDLYKQDKRKACGVLLGEITEALRAVTLNAPNSDIMEAIYTVRRLYQAGLTLEVDQYLQLARKLAKAYEAFKDEPVFQQLISEVLEYNQILKDNALSDYQVRILHPESKEATVKKETISSGEFFKLMIGRFIFLVFILIFCLPGLIINLPIGAIAKYMAEKKRREALANSTVKKQALDVLGSYKVLYSFVLCPLFYAFYAIIFWFYVDNFLAALIFWWLLPLFSYASVLVFQEGVVTFGSLKMALTLKSSEKRLLKIAKMRAQLVTKVRKLVSEWGPRLDPGFEENRIITEQELEEADAKAPTLSEALRSKRRPYKQDKANSKPLTFDASDLPNS